MSRGKWAVVLAACIVLAAVAAAYAAGQAKVSAPEVIRAQRFELVDEKGSPRAMLGLLLHGGPGFTLYDEKGNMRATLMVLPDGSPGFTFSDEKLVLLADRGPGLTLYDEKGKMRAGLTVLPDGGPILELLDSSGRILFHAPGAPKALPTAPVGLPDSFQTPSVIESYIDGEFTGWEGETIFKLDNGQIWQQSRYAYHYHYAYHPKVTIVRTRAGSKMLVEGVDESVYVVRLK